MNEIKRSRIQINIRSLIINNNFISIANANKYPFNLLTLSLPYRAFKRFGISTNKLTIQINI